MNTYFTILTSVTRNPNFPIKFAVRSNDVCQIRQAYPSGTRIYFCDGAIADVLEDFEKVVKLLNDEINQDKKPILNACQKNHPHDPL